MANLEFFEMIYDIKWGNGFKAIFRDPNATTADCRGIRHRSAYVRNLVGAGVHSTTMWIKFYSILTTYNISSGQLWTLYTLPFVHVEFLLPTSRQLVRGVGGQKKPNFVNVVCECHLTIFSDGDMFKRNTIICFFSVEI